jgi:hypothetical protein
MKLRLLIAFGLVAIVRAEDAGGELLDREEVAPTAEEALPSVIRPAERPAVQRVVSESGQFGVSGGDAALRSSVALEAESLRLRYHRLSGFEPKDAGMPVEIVLHGEVGGPPRARSVARELRFTSEGFLLRIHADLSRGLNRDQLERAVISGLVLGRELADREPGPLESPLRVPPWLIEGIREAWAWGEGRANRKLYEGVFERGAMMPLDEFLAMSEAAYERLDGVRRAIFQVQSGALVMALVEQPDGKEGFAGLCEEIGSYEGEYPLLLRTKFPGMNLSEKSLAKWWALTLAKLADAPLTEVMGIAETEERLAAALVLRFSGAVGERNSLPVDRWRELPEMGEAERVEVVRPVQDALNQLSYRCFPSYRPLLVDYHHWLASWARGEKEPEPRLAEMQEAREIMSQRARMGHDYLDFTEISEARELTGGFDDYLRLKDQSRERQPEERADPVSRYLDTIEKLYGGDR